MTDIVDDKEMPSDEEAMAIAMHQHEKVKQDALKSNNMPVTYGATLCKEWLINQVATKADEYQTRFLGANSSQREARFAQNLEAAKRLLSDSYSDDALGAAQRHADTTAMTLQAKAQALKTGEAEKTPEEFALWIVEWQPKTVLLTGAIEAMSVEARAKIAALKTIEELQAFEQGMDAHAEAKFAEITGGGTVANDTPEAEQPDAATDKAADDVEAAK